MICIGWCFLTFLLGYVVCGMRNDIDGDSNDAWICIVSLLLAILFWFGHIFSKLGII